MNPKRIAAAVFFAAALGCAPAAGAQSGRGAKAEGQPAADEAPRMSCPLKKSPELLGLRLGMSADELKSLFPRLRLPAPDELGVAVVTLEGDDLAGLPGSASELGRASDLSLELTDGRLSYVRLGYPVTMRWNSSDEFVARVADWLNLPGGWRHFYDRGDKTFRDIEDFRDLSLECADFSISAGVGVESLGEQTPHVKLEDTGAARVVRSREDERARREREASPPKEKP